MEKTIDPISVPEADMRQVILQVKQYMDKTMLEVTTAQKKTQAEKDALQQELEVLKEHLEAKTQLINSLLGDLSKLQNDLDWYKRTYERRSILGTLRQKLLSRPPKDE
ncbi:MAG: hypothetical protein KGO82_11340 [Bacteroidota bacterium]|nr:hypothetical protein [Bacteroidota bacterium]